MAAPPTKLISYEDSLELPEDSLEEIVHGECRRMPPATAHHGALLHTLQKILTSQLDPARYEVLATGFGLGIERTPTFTCRIPDLTVYSIESLNEDPDNPYLWRPPELLVECLSPSNRKGSVWELLADYERAAVPEVWLLQPVERTLTTYVLTGNSLVEARRTSSGPISPIRLPEAKVEIEDLWNAFGRRLRRV
ncbi:MAG: Uma2 family endonuclease [Bryobacteraceae bacterium]